jgi:hypothetical protein
MSFESYKNIAEVLKEFNIRSTEVDFIQELNFSSRISFQEELEFCLREFVVEESEYAVCETIIFPVLKEVYRTYRKKFTLWSHKSINYNEKLSGIPDYILAKRSPLGKEVFEKPFFVTVEAKKDNFIKGWGQCLAEMLALQHLNQGEEIKAVFGIVSNGQLWQFGKIEDNIFSKNITSYTISQLDSLLGAIAYVFEQCSES